MFKDVDYNLLKVDIILTPLREKITERYENDLAEVLRGILDLFTAMNKKTIDLENFETFTPNDDCEKKDSFFTRVNLKCFENEGWGKPIIPFKLIIERGKVKQLLKKHDENIHFETKKEKKELTKRLKNLKRLIQKMDVDVSVKFTYVNHHNKKIFYGITQENDEGYLTIITNEGPYQLSFLVEKYGDTLKQYIDGVFNDFYLTTKNHLKEVTQVVKKGLKELPPIYINHTYNKDTVLAASNKFKMIMIEKHLKVLKQLLK